MVSISPTLLAGVRLALNTVGCDVTCTKLLKNYDTYNVETGTVDSLSPAYTPVIVRGYFSGYSQYEISQGWVQVGDRKLILSVDANYVPEIGDKISSLKGDFRVMNVTPIEADNETTVLWKLQLRQ